MAEKEGFEPSVLAYTRFPGVHLKPLGHLSTTFSHPVIHFLGRMGRLTLIDSLSILRMEISQSKISDEG